MKYIIVVDKQPRTNPSNEKRETTIEIEELRRKGEVHDDFVIEQGIAKVYRRIGLTKTHMTYVLDKQIIEELGELKIKLFQGDNYIYIKDEYNNHLCAEFVIKNDFTDRYVTNLQMESAIEETASSIKLYVGQALEGYSNTEETKAMIKMQADEIKESVSQTYTTKVEMDKAKTDAINSANSSTDEKLKDYSTTEEVDSAIAEKTQEISKELSAEMDMKANEVSTTVSESTTAAILTLLNNGYLTAEQVNALVEGNKEDIATIKNQLKQTITDEQMRIEISKAIEGGVSYLKNTLFTIDENGMAIATSEDEFNALYNNKGMYLYSYDELMARYDKDGAYFKNLEITGELRTENLRLRGAIVKAKKRAHIHWIGGR